MIVNIYEEFMKFIVRAIVFCAIPLSVFVRIETVFVLPFFVFIGIEMVFVDIEVVFPIAFRMDSGVTRVEILYGRRKLNAGYRT